MARANPRASMESVLDGWEGFLMDFNDYKKRCGEEIFSRGETKEQPGVVIRRGTSKSEILNIFLMRQKQVRGDS